MPQYLNYYGTNTTGNLTGIIFAIYNIGSLPAIAIAGPLNDKYGRRVGMFVGCVFVIIGTCVQAPSKNIGTFMGGRFLLGFGSSFIGISAPTLVRIIFLPYTKFRQVSLLILTGEAH